MEISTDERFHASLIYLANKFKRTIQKVDQRYLLTLPKRTNEYQLLDAIIYQIVNQMKAKYLQDRLQIKHETLIKVLVNYDKKTDLVIASALIKITPVMLLDAIYDFGINRLKCRWDEVVDLVNDNRIQLAQKPMFDELLRFLILNMDYKIKEAHVMAINQKVTVCDSKLEPLPQNDTSVINTLIDLAPRQIFIHADPDLSKELVNEIEQLFPNCVCIEYQSVL